MKIFEITEDIIAVNNIDHAIERVKVAADLCSKMGNQPILYRGFNAGGQYPYKPKNLILKVDNAERVGVKGNHNPIQQQVFKGLNIQSPVQAVAVAPDSTSSLFGTNYIMIPGGNFTAHWNPAIRDLGGFDGYDPKFSQLTKNGGRLTRDTIPPEEMKQILDGYQEGIPGPKQWKGEVIVDCPFYYMLNLQEFLSKYAGKKVKELIDVNNRASFSKIKADLLQAKFVTYRDISWYLSKPATSFLQWIKNQEGKK